MDTQQRSLDRNRTGTARGLGPNGNAAARPVAAVLACGLGIVVVFQAALVTGAPWGAAAYGGSQTGQLPSDLRVASAFQGAFWVFAALTALSRGGIIRGHRWHAFSTRAIWALAAFLAVGAVMNAASSSSWERFGWAPYVLALTVLSIRLARTPVDVPRRVADPDPEPWPRPAPPLDRWSGRARSCRRSGPVDNPREAKARRTAARAHAPLRPRPCHARPAPATTDARLRSNG